MPSLVGTLKGRNGFLSDAIFRAFAFSFAIHVAIFAGSVISSLGLFQRAHQQLSEKERGAERERPLDFIEVKIQQTASEAPKDAKFYGAVNMVAANAATEKPQIKPVPQPLRPSVSPPVPAETKVEAKSVEKSKPTDLAMAKDSGPKKKEETPKPKPVESLQPEPRPGAELKPDPTVKHHDLVSSPGVKGSLSGGYDQRFIDTVHQRWNALLEQVSSSKPGKVVLDFQISYDGRISDLIVRETTVNEMQTMLCKKAILDPAPYPRWAAELRKELKQDLRDVTFTFIYSE